MINLQIVKFTYENKLLSTNIVTLQPKGIYISLRELNIMISFYFELWLILLIFITTFSSYLWQVTEIMN
jgi:hypothetical protein